MLNFKKKTEKLDEKKVMTCGFVVQILPISIPISSQIWCLFMYFFLEDILFYVCLCYVLATYLPSLLLFPLLFVPCGAVVTRAVHGLISIGRISIFHGLAQSSLLKYSIRCRATTHWCLLSKSCPMNYKLI